MTLVYIQVRCEQPEGPEGNVSRYTVRPGTLGLTLVLFISALDSLALLYLVKLTQILSRLVFSISALHRY